MASQGLGFPPYIQTNNVGSQYSLNGELPPEIAVKEQAINRRQQIANLMMQQGLKPLHAGGMAGRFYVPPSWTQGMEKLGNVLAGVYGNYRAGKDQASLADENNTLQASAIQKYLEGTSDVPAQAATPAQPGAPVPTYEGQQIDLGGMVNQPGGGSAFLNYSGAQPVAPAQLSEMSRLKQEYPLSASNLPNQPNTPPQAPAQPNMADVISMRPGPEVPGTPEVPGRPRTPQEKLAAMMQFRSTMGGAANPFIAAQQHQEQMQQQSADKAEALTQRNKEFDATQDFRKQELGARHEDTRLLREQRSEEIIQKYEDRKESRGQREREINEKLADARTAHEDKMALEKEKVRMRDEEQRDKMKLDERLAKMEDNARRDIAKMKVDNKGSDVKLKPGEELLPDGTVRARKGSDLYIKQSSSHAKDYGALQTMNTKTDMATKKIDEVLDKKNESAFNSNFGGYNAKVTKYLPGAQDVRNKIESIKSDLKTAGLEVIRSGGGIGQMTEREWPIVEKMIDSIDETLSEPAARETFGKIKAYMQKIRDNAKSTYDTEWGDSQYYKGKSEQASASAPAGGGQVLRFDAQGNPIQ